MLRRLSGEAQPTKLEARILAEVKSRVTNWSRLDTPEFQLSYDFDDDKKQQSRGTEAILYALILSLDDRFHGLAEPNPLTTTALANLWTTQITEGDHQGSWEWLNFGLEPWESNSGRYLGASLAASPSALHPPTAAHRRAPATLDGKVSLRLNTT